MLFFFCEHKRLYKALGALYRHSCHPGDRLLSKRHGQGFRLQPRPVTGGARIGAHVFLYGLPDIIRLRFQVPSPEIGECSFKIGAVTPASLPAPEHCMLMLCRKSVKWSIQVNTIIVGNLLEFFPEPALPWRVFEASYRLSPGNNGPVTYGKARVRDDQVGIQLKPGADSRAFRAGSVRRIKGKQPGLKLFDRYAAVRA